MIVRTENVPAVAAYVEKMKTPEAQRKMEPAEGAGI
jgi:hypothetical protein